MTSVDQSPAYRDLDRDTLQARADALFDRYQACDCCPYQCGVDRTAGEIGQCGLKDEALVASAGPHFGEEPPLVGSGGSGTIFLAGCPLSCVFCQNYRISQELDGEARSPDDIADMAISLQQQGCANVNFVTPTHVPGHLVRAIAIARERGLSIPVVWNCGGYESVGVLEALDGIVDIYMPDLKYADAERAVQYSGAPSYPERAQAALTEMHSQVGDLRVEGGVATRGLLVRHLLLPGHVQNSKDVLEFIAAELGTDTYVNLMGQYRPAHQVPGSAKYAEIDHRPRRDEYRAVVEFGRELGLSRLQVDDRFL